MCLAPTLGSIVHHVLVHGSVANTHRSNKIDIKTYFLLITGKNTLQSLCLHSLGHWPYNIHQSFNTTVLRSCGSIPTGNLECGRKPYP
jgi:hypothetical protein